MKSFECDCGQLLFFENTVCNSCGAMLGYLPDQQRLAAIKPQGNERWVAAGEFYRQCTNYQHHQVCNWMIKEGDDSHFCHACRLNHTIPNLEQPNNRYYWYLLEQAKRRLLVGLYALRLPVVGRDHDPDNGICFSFLEELPTFQESETIITGHAHGMITINVAEADDVARETMRSRMNEPYRTLLGHMRHESGHYYWEHLINGTRYMDEFRRCFGDERMNYDQALEGYYRQGSAANWQLSYISAYASAHPWEDWAESWAHYLHILDTLETASDFGLSGKRAQLVVSEPYDRAVDFSQLLSNWESLVVALNSISRSMGQADLYPFHIPEAVHKKLSFIHQRVIESTPYFPNQT